MRNDDPAASGENLLEGKSNYLIGSEEQWRRDVANYGAVRYDEVYDGIDLRYYGNQRQLEYDFLVNAGADAGAIRLEFDGAQGVSVDENGNLVLDSRRRRADHRLQGASRLPGGARRARGGGRAATSCSMTAASASRLGSYDASRELVIDPVLSYGTYLGGSGGEQIWNMDIDAAGNVYVTGYTTSTNLPTTAGALSGFVSNQDVFVSKFSADLGTLVYSTYLGGGGDEHGYNIAVDAAGNAYVTGYTTSTDFPFVSPLTSPPWPAARTLSSSSSTHPGTRWSTRPISAAPAAAISATGSRWTAPAAPTSPAMPPRRTSRSRRARRYELQRRRGLRHQAQCHRQHAGLLDLHRRQRLRRRVHRGGRCHRATRWWSARRTRPTCRSPLPPTRPATAANSDAFVAMLNAAGTGLVYGTYLGGNQRRLRLRRGRGPGGKIYITGDTSSNDFDVTAGAMQTSRGGGADGFVSVIDPTASGSASLVYSTFVGGSSTESFWGIDVDTAGRVYAAGYTASNNLTVTANAHQSVNRGGEDIFVLVLDPTISGAAGRVYASYLGGTGQEDAWAAGYANGRFYVAGNAATSSGLTPSGYDTSFNGGFDGYVAAFSIETPPVVTTTPGVLSYAESAGPVAVSPSLTLVDDDSASLAGATIRITGNYLSSEDLLAFNNLNPWGISGTWTSATGTLTLTGISSVANYQAALRSVTYQNTSEKPSTLTRSVTFTATDGGLTSAAAIRQIAVSSINDPAVNTVPGTQPGTEDAPVIFSAGNGNQISIADVDAGTAPIQVTLTATNGRLSLAQISGLAFVSGDGSTDVSMTFTGTIANINAALNGLRFDPNANYNGPASVQIATNDLGNSGSGGAQITNSTVNIDLGAVNDAPVQSVPGSQSTAQNAPLVFSSGTGNAITLADIDAGGGDLRVTLTGTNGTLILGSVAGLSSVLGDGTSVVTLTGTLANLNGALDGLRFVPTFNYSGAAGLTVATDDQGNTGSGGPRTDSDAIAITVSPNIVPTITLSPAPLAYAEGAPATAVDPALNLTDPDNPILDHAQVRIVAGYVQGEDELSFTDQLGITGSWNALTGTLVLTGAASPADYRTALRTVAFRNSSDNPTGTRTVSFVVNDGIADSAAVTRERRARTSERRADHHRSWLADRTRGYAPGVLPRHRQPDRHRRCGRGRQPGAGRSLRHQRHAEPAADHRTHVRGRRRRHRQHELHRHGGRHQRRPERAALPRRRRLRRPGGRGDRRRRPRQYRRRTAGRQPHRPHQRHVGERRAGGNR